MSRQAQIEVASETTRNTVAGHAGEGALRVETEVPLAVALDHSRKIAAAMRAAARKARAPSLMISGGGGFKARRGDRLFFRGIIISFIALILLPFLAASIYLPFIAADQFASEARFAIRSGKSSPISAIVGMASGGSSKQTQDSLIISSFLQSRAVIDELETRFDLKSIFAPRGYDFIFSFSPEDPKERLVRYWRQQVTVNLDRTTGIMSVEVRAFRAEDALAICKALVEISERMVNELTERARKDALGFAEREVKRSEKRLEEASNRMRDIRNQEGVLDADAQAGAINDVVTKLQLSLTRIEQDIGAASPQLSKDAPQLRYMHAQAKALRERIADFRRLITNNRPNASGSSLSASASLLDQQKIEAKIAMEQYAGSIAAFEMARAELETQSSFLLTFLKPSLAEEAEYPKRWLLWFTIILPAAILWAFLMGIAMLIRDHMPN